ncbi:hypothetical protein I4U23_002417 [Adineta vaga]|nr:hypothetical protein I4U23_002417 [Adineta vaga]
MTSHVHQMLLWLKAFKTVWLLENIQEDIHLRELIIAKLSELENLINVNIEDEEEYYRAKLLYDHSSSNSDTEQITSDLIPAVENVRLTSTDNRNDEEQARQALLEDSDNSDIEQEVESIIRPAICLKRISQQDAELYMPLAWRNEDFKTSTEKGSRTKQSSTPTNSNDAAGNSNTFENITNNEKSCKRRSHTSDNDQIDKSSKARKNNETSTTSSTSDDDDDYTIKYRTRRQSISNKVDKTPSKSHRSRRNSHRKKEVIINYNSSPEENQVLSDHSVNADGDQNLMDNNNESENHDQESEMPLRATLSEKLTKKTNNETNNVVENISNDEMNPPSASESDHDRSIVNVTSYSHLLNQSKSLSESEDDENPKTKKSSKTSKRVLPSSPNSDVSTVKYKKAKTVIKHRADLSLSTDNSDNDSTSTVEEATTSSSRRIRIQRSSSEESNVSNEILSKKSNDRRKKATVSKKKKKKSSSSSTTTSDDNGTNRSKSKKSKSKLSDDDSDESSDDENKSPSKRKHGRKNIRKILDDKELDIQTKDAIEAEQERRKRIAEKQKEYNETLLEQSSFHSNNEADQTNHRLILELDKITNEPLIEVSPALVEQLKPHQCEGVRFLWNNVFESIEAIQKRKHNGNGCILAHCMGLGKTLQIISFIHTIFNYDQVTNVKTCLVLCPINAALNWSNEFDHWLKNIEPPVDHYQLTTIKTNLRASHLNYWYENGGVMIMGYEMYRRLANGFGIKSKNAKANAYRCLVDPGPDIVVADEGHILKNAQTALAKCLSKIKTLRRIVLTGTPLQNNLIEYFCMVSFIKPKLLGTQSEYINRFVNPIQNGQHRDSNEDDVRLMKRRACVLHGLLTGFVDRKDYSLLQEYLPPKFEYIINIRLSDLQSELYEIYLKKHVNQEQRSLVSKKDFKSAQLFADYQFLQKIWTHPFLLYPHFIDRWKKQLNVDDDDESVIDDNELEIIYTDDEDDMEGNKKTKKNKSETTIKQPEVHTSYSGFLIDNIDDEIRPTTSNFDQPPLSNASTTSTIDSTSVDSIDDNPSKETKTNSKSDNSDDDIEIIRTYPTRSRATTTTTDKQNAQSSKATDSNIFHTENEQIPAEESVLNTTDPWLDAMREQFWFPLLDAIPEENRFDLELSGKFLILKFILDKCFEIGDKVLLFSRSLYTLNRIEKFLQHIQIQNEKEYLKQCESRRQLRELLASDDNSEPMPNETIPQPIEWKRDYDYFRMDGQTEVTARKRYAKTFNDASNSRARLFLISTLAGGIGINLTGSNRVIVFDASWNPSHDTQAIFRSYRFGQKKPVYIYRFLAHGTMEEKIYQRQVVKQSISQRVVDDHQLDRHFTQNDIKELYNFKREKLPEARSASTLLTELGTEFNYAVPKDHLLLDLLYEHNRWIHSYHSHDSLLENKIDEGLTEEERRKALEEYENLKRLPDQRQLALERYQNQQRLNAMIAQQQTAAAAQAQARMQDANLMQLINEYRQSIHLPNGVPLDYSQLLQFAHNRAPNRGPAINDRTNNVVRTATKRVQKSTTNTTPILPRPTTSNTTVSNPNLVVLVGSDSETDNNSTNPT